MAKSVADTSPDPYKKVGCVGFDSCGRALVGGRNSGPAHIGPEAMFWRDREERRHFMIHAEQDMAARYAFMEGDEWVDFVIITLLPCVQCMNLLAALQVKKIYYLEAYDKDLKAIEVAALHGIELEQIKDGRD